jgi:signal transduction histidine kinase
LRLGEAEQPMTKLGQLGAANRPLRVLIVEDNPDDYTLLVKELLRGGYEPLHRRVENREDMLAALAESSWDIVLTDWSLPRFSALEALRVVRETNDDLPCIIVSGTIGDEIAVEALRNGARDFVVKDRMARLVPAITRELREVALRQERKRIQEQLVISDRMVSIGMLAAGVAHEINNPLAVVLSNIELAVSELETLQGSSDVTSIIEEMTDANAAAQRIRDIVRDLKLFSRASDDASGPVDVHRVLESTLRMAWNEIRHRARLRRELQSVPFVEANESRLGQVFLNLVINAAQSLPDGHADQNEIVIATRVGEDGRVVVEIRDTGSGMSPEVKKRLFTPFFTTKPIGVGTGLGLSIVHRIVTALGGELGVDSELGRGTTFRVHLPVSARRPEPSIPARTIAPVRRGRILIVDDERLVANAFSRALRMEHDVVVRNRGREVLEMLEAGERFDAIVCDLMMPEMTGIQLYEAVTKLAPEQAKAMIFVSGGAFTSEARVFLDRVANPRLEKPFRLATLVALVNDRLRG